jgi:hypothetical protein
MVAAVSVVSVVSVVLKELLSELFCLPGPWLSRGGPSVLG